MHLYLDNLGPNSTSWNRKPIFEVDILNKNEFGLLYLFVKYRSVQLKIIWWIKKQKQPFVFRSYHPHSSIQIDSFNEDKIIWLGNEIYIFKSLIQLPLLLSK